MSSDKVPAAGMDGRLRCPWAGSAPDYCDYHDDEWGVPVHGEAALFERLSLEAFQSGLSWLTILRKRDAFRRAFVGFRPTAVAAFTDDDVARLLADTGIIRNRAKIEATVRNARAVTELDEDLDTLLWSYAPDPAGRPAHRDRRGGPHPRVRGDGPRAAQPWLHLRRSGHLLCAHAGHRDGR